MTTTIYLITCHIFKHFLLISYFIFFYYLKSIMYKNINEILFDPGGSKISMSYHPGTQLKKKAFRYKRCHEPGIQITEPKYNSKVLEGNWYEEQIKRSPTIENINNNLNDMNNYKPKKNITASEIARLIKIKNEGLGSSLIIQMNDNKYLNNYSTTYDLMYRVFPQNLNGPRIRTYNGRMNRWVPQQDFTENFGNITRYGMKENIRALQEEAICGINEKLRTHYQCDFTVKEIPTEMKRFHRKRVDIYKPDWNKLEQDSSIPSRWKRSFSQRLKHINLCKKVSQGKY